MIHVKLTEPLTPFNDDQGKRFEAHVVHEVEESDRIKAALKINVLTKVKAPEKAEEVPPPVPEHEEA